MKKGDIILLALIGVGGFVAYQYIKKQKNNNGNGNNGTGSTLAGIGSIIDGVGNWFS